MDTTPSEKNSDHALVKENVVDSNNVLSAIAEAMEAYFKGDGEFDLDLEKVKLRIYLKGPKWLGVVDKPVAEFLLQLEKELIAEIEKLGIKLPKWERGLLALEVDEGSWDGVISYSAEAISYFKTLVAANQTVIVGAVVAAVGALSAVRRKVDEPSPIETQKAKDLLTDLEQQEGVQAQQIEVTDTPPSEMRPDQEDTMQKLDAIQADSSQLQRPIRKLLGHMKDEDIVILPGASERMERSVAIKTLEKRSRESRKDRPTFYVDHPYIVEFLDSKTPGKWKVKIRFGTLSFPAHVALADAELPKLFKAYNAAGGKNDVVCDLQVTAQFDSKGKPKNAIVAGWGKPRKQSITISEGISRGKKYRHPARG